MRWITNHDTAHFSVQQGRDGRWRVKEPGGVIHVRETFQSICAVCWQLRTAEDY